MRLHMDKLRAANVKCECNGGQCGACSLAATDADGLQPHPAALPRQTPPNPMLIARPLPPNLLGTKLTARVLALSQSTLSLSRARTMSTKPSLAAAEDFLSFVNASPTRMLVHEGILT